MLRKTNKLILNFLLKEDNCVASTFVVICRSGLIVYVKTTLVYKTLGRGMNVNAFSPSISKNKQNEMLEMSRGYHPKLKFSILTKLWIDIINPLFQKDLKNINFNMVSTMWQSENCYLATFQLTNCKLLIEISISKFKKFFLIYINKLKLCYN